MAKIQAVLAKSSSNLLTHSFLFTIFAPTLAKAASFGVGGPSSEASLFLVVLSLLLRHQNIILQNCGISKIRFKLLARVKETKEEVLMYAKK